MSGLSPEFRAWADKARAVRIEDEISRRGIRLRGTPEMVGPCPVCGGRDRFSVNVKKQVFHCRAGGVGGDVIAMVRYLDACDFKAACETLTNEPPPDGTKGEVDEKERKRREAEYRRAAAQREAEANDFRERERKRAHGIWKAGRPAVGTPVETHYLNGRGLVLPRSAPIRYLENAAYWIERQPQGGTRAIREVLHNGPAMLTAITDDTGAFAGVHITWFDPERPGEKMTLVHPETGEILPAKKIRGSKRCAAIKLIRPDGPVRHLYIGEGIETVLSVAMAVWKKRGADALAGTAFWTAVDLQHLGGKAAQSVKHPSLTRTDKAGRRRALKVPGPDPDMGDEKALMPPASADQITTLGDGDSDRFTAEQVHKRAARRWAKPGRAIRTAFAPKGRDFNDVLRGIRPAEGEGQ